MFRVELSEIKETILCYQDRIRNLEDSISQVSECVQELQNSWSGEASDITLHSIHLKMEAMEKTKAQMQRMVDIMSQTMEPILFRELNRCDGFFQTITTLAPPEPSYWRTAGGSVRLELDRIPQVNQAAEMIRCQIKEERRIWRDAMSCLGGGLEYSGLDLREEDRNVEEEFRKQDCYMNQFQDAFHTYTQTIWDLEIRLMEDFKTVEDMGAGCGIRKIGPLLSWDKTFNEDRLIGLMNSSPDRLTETDFTDMIMTLDRVDLVEDMGLLGKILKGMYQVEGTPDGSGAYRLTYRLSKVAFDLSKRYQAHMEETVKKGLVSQEEQGLLGLKACLLSGLTAEYAVLYGGTTAMLSKLTGGRTSTIDVQEFLKSVIDKSLELSEKKYQAFELVWDNLQKPLDDHLSGDLGDFLVDLTAFTPGFSVIVGYEILGTFVASRIWGKEAAESYWDVRNRALKGYIKGAIDTELDILKSTLLMGMKTSNQIEFSLRLNKTYAEIWEFGVVNYGKAVLKGIGEDLLSLWTKLKDGDAQERGEAVGGLAVQAALAYWSVSEILTSIKAIKAAKAAKGLAAGAGLVDDGLGLLDDAVKAADNIVGMADDAAGAVDDIAGVADDAANFTEGGSGALEGPGKTLTPEEINAINRYTGDDYWEINRSLRGLGDTSDANKITIENLKSALNKAELSDDMILYRGTDKAELGALKDLEPEGLVGKTFEQPSFMSTSAKDTVATGTFQGDLHMTIEAPQGAKGMNISSMSQYGDVEAEILFQAGTEMIIKEAEIVDNVLHITVEIIN